MPHRFIPTEKKTAPFVVNIIELSNKKENDLYVYALQLLNDQLKKCTPTFSFYTLSYRYIQKVFEGKNSSSFDFPH